MDATRKQTREKVLKTLNQSQRKMIAKFEEERLRRGRGEPGRPGYRGRPISIDGDGPRKE